MASPDESYMSIFLNSFLNGKEYSNFEFDIAMVFGF
jgi:hypothetical protein